jgi:uncharacterized cysteine cluster protein YcgN (CxxCxxCC family)
MVLCRPSGSCALPAVTNASRGDVARKKIKKKKLKKKTKLCGPTTTRAVDGQSAVHE